MDLHLPCCKSYRKLYCLAIFFCLTLLLSQAQAQLASGSELPGFTITLTVPANTPPDASIYVAGSFNGWQTDSASHKLTAQADGSYKITLPPEVRGKIEFKFTLGSWASAETQADGGESPNRSADIASATSYQGAVQAWKLPVTNLAELKLELEKVLAETHTPGLSLAIVRKEGVEWAAGLGLADVANKRPATADTLFRIGSVSKNFAALAILQLVNEGALSLQDPVRKLVPEVVFANPWEETDPVRVVDLLEHTTGWDDMHFREYAKDAPGITTLDALNYHFASRVSRWRPGTRMSYSNTGPAVAAFIVEKITGQVFEDYIKQKWFIPIGMNSATYFQPAAEQTTELYHSDGKSPYPYWNILFRPAGSINASANDMAAYLSFFLHRGEVNGTRLLPASAIDRIETATRSWSAQAGLRSVYALYNTVTIDDGRVFHGHDGGVNGGVTSFTYLPEQGVGFFYSINSGNGDAYMRIRSLLRDYVVRGLDRPVPPPAIPLSEKAKTYTGWYEPASPRNQQIQFLERFLKLAHLSVVDDQLKVRPLMGQEASFIPVTENLFRLSSEPIATFALIPANSEGLFVAGNETLKRIPSWLVYLELGLAAGFTLALISILLYAPFWLVAGCCKSLRRPQEFWLKFWPFIAALGLIALSLFIYTAGEDFIVRLGRLSIYSVGIFIATLIFAAAAVASAIALYSVERKNIRRFIYIYSLFVVAMLLIATAYLSYWGVIGIRFWH